ncbi:uncharacterized protein LOC115889741 [Sitophilus oryzae]|uniref:Uncharacterized protein LOC115889741 n=1 Tax=Sitophilus oryzae TaxID=7048 RepID=A0A6J2YQW3_SITOR|nr:uncharacterized protein LOC115889741 [Sitophilus oryzae]
MIYPYMNKNTNNKYDTTEAETEQATLSYPRYKVNLLEDDSIKYLYQRRIKHHLQKEQPKHTIEEEHTRITQAVHQAMQEAVGYKEQIKNQPIWMTDKLEEKISEKKLNYNNWLGNPTDENWLAYKKLQKEVRQQVTEEKNSMWERKCNDIETYIGGFRSTEAWRTLKGMKANTRERWTGTISLSDWREHYENLLIEQRPQFLQNNEAVTITEARTNISIEEVNQALVSMKNGRALGPGGIMAEMLKYGGECLITEITNLMQMCVDRNKIPNEWKLAYITSIYKKGNRKDPNNYRGLSVNCTFSRLFTKIIRNKLEISTYNKISQEQSGFTAGRSCIDNLFTIQQLREKRNSREEDTHLAFVNLQKAYDSIPRVKLWYILEQLDVDECLINLIKVLYNNNTARDKKR